MTTLITGVSARLGRANPTAAAAWNAYRNQDSDVAQWARHTVEKIRSAWGAGQFTQLAWWENLTEETPEVRDAYHGMLKESVVKAALRKAVTSVASQDAQTHPVSPDDPRERHGADLFLTALKRIGVDYTGMRKSHGLCGTRKVAWNILTGGMIQGWSANECVWNEDGPERIGPLKGLDTWRDFKAKDSRYLWPVVDAYKNVVGLRVNTGGMKTLADEELRDIVIYAHWSLYESPLGISEFRAAYRAYWCKHMARNLRLLRLDRFKGPFLKGVYPNEAVKAALEVALSNARADGWMTMPAGAMVDILDLSMGDTSEFKDFEADCDREMLVGMLGAHLMMMEGDSGSPRGDTAIHAKTGEAAEWYLAAVVGDVVTSQMAPAWYARNFADLPPCSVTWGSISDQDMMARALLYEQLQKIGVEMSKKAAQSEFAISVPAGAGDVLKPGGGSGGGGGPDQGGPGGLGGGGQPPQSPGAPFGPPPDAAFAEPYDTFCNEGRNKGKPGPCPEHAEAAAAMTAKHPFPGPSPPYVPGMGAPNLLAKDPALRAAKAAYDAHTTSYNRAFVAETVRRMVSEPPRKPVPLSDNPKLAVTRTKQAIERVNEVVTDLATLTEEWRAEQRAIVAGSHPQGKEALRAAYQEAVKRRTVAVNTAREHVAALPPGQREQAEKLLRKVINEGAPDATFSEAGMPDRPFGWDQPPGW